jgi:NitT/TauT family transport system substrate-binding protein
VSFRAGGFQYGNTVLPSAVSPKHRDGPKMRLASWRHRTVERPDTGKPLKKRTLLGGAASLGVLALTGRPARAEATEVRFARQFSMGYLQFNVMEHQGLLEKHAKRLGLDGVKATWVTFNGPDAMNGALISDSVDVVAGGIPGLVTFWARTKGTAQEVRGIASLSAQPCLLNTRNPAAQSIADLGAQDRIALPTVKVSIQAVTLEMAAAKQFGKAEYAKLDPLTVSMSPPDATVALLSGAAGVTCAFSVPPFQEQQLEKPGIRTLLNSFSVAGPHSFSLCWTSARFRDRNPTLFKALIAALQEATEIVNADKRAAAGLWLTDSKSSLPLDLVASIVSGPQVTWGLAPQGTVRYAQFMHDAGSTRIAPETWRDMFFPDIHDLQGS